MQFPTCFGKEDDGLIEPPNIFEVENSKLFKLLLISKSGSFCNFSN